MRKEQRAYSNKNGDYYQNHSTTDESISGTVGVDLEDHRETKREFIETQYNRGYIPDNSSMI